MKIQCKKHFWFKIRFFFVQNIVLILFFNMNYLLMTKENEIVILYILIKSKFFTSYASASWANFSFACGSSGFVSGWYFFANWEKMFTSNSESQLCANLFFLCVFSNLVVRLLNLFLSGCPSNPENLIEVLLTTYRGGVEEMSALKLYKKRNKYTNIEPMNGENIEILNRRHLAS